MLKQFTLSDELLIHMAAEPARDDALTLLASGQISKRLLLIRHIRNACPKAAWDGDPAIELLSLAQRDSPAIAGEILTAPCVGGWAVHVVRHLSGTVECAVPLQVELTYLNAIALVLAIRTGGDADLPLHVRDGLVLLPTLGAVRVDLPEHSAVRARVRQGRLTLDTGARRPAIPGDYAVETEDWLPLRGIRAEAGGQVISLMVEDLDPYRHCYDKTPGARLSKEDFDRLADLTRQAWEILVACASDRAGELAVGLRSLVPLSDPTAGSGLSATSPTSYGALALTIPERPEHLGATLVHEFQHSKLSALLDLCPLYDETATGHYFVAWKPEPRPFSGLLQGAYAFLMVSSYWHSLFRAGHRHGAERNFAEHRVQVDNAITTLEESGRLNAEGRIFVSRMRETMAELLAVPVAPEVDEAARHGLKQTYQDWCERNGPGLSWSVHPSSAR